VGSAKYASSSIAEADVYENGLELFPNPVINEINLKSGNDLSGGNVRIINMLGTEVMNVNSTSVIDVSSLESGMYTLIYSKDGNKMVKKFVK
jgi:hypothetical protein